ncbi:serine hydroxymethyltransferase [Micromonospora sp. WMMA1363]|uniref:serine hydroxymethyltransferase n=1 Tax=Micromonospora sp. WMMA1363 TaxID=3053985 RepID=UPI00259CA20C|nr:serine hydroxymethyltransferase [Micromonospora sp. WMMA1363]MDM4721522.1 serine hydroxymethyltransferase [Micromonospora sp. WMMA1363]
MDVLEILRGKASLNLFPIENRLSPRASEALSSDANNRYPYVEGPVTHYGDVMGLGGVYDYCVDLAKEYLGAQYGCVHFLSGLHTMYTVITALVPAGSRVMVLDPEDGGHYATITICEGLGHTVSRLPFDRDSLLIDYERLADQLRREPVDAIYLDASSVLRLPDARALRAAAPDTLLFLDASHLMGLLPAAPQTTVLDGGFDTIQGSTHKTLPGPQKGLMVTNREDLAVKVAARIPYTASSSHAANVGALAITLEELLPCRIQYAHQIVANARELAGRLAERGFGVAGEAFGWTDTHQVWLDIPAEVGPHRWGRLLTHANVRSTTVPLPSSNGLPALRLGTQELTRMGMKEQEMGEVASILDRILLRGEDPDSVADSVAALVAKFPDVKFVGEPA